MNEGGRNPAKTVVVVGLHELVKSPATLLEAFWIAASVSWAEALAAVARHGGNREELSRSLGAAAYKAPARLAYCDDVKEKYFDMIRDSVDKLELLVNNEDWPLVKYRELLFLR